MKTEKMVVILILTLALPAEIANADFTFGTPTNLGPTVNSSAFDDAASISTDGSTLFFMSGRPGGYGINDLWVTTRTTTEDDWGTPVNLGPTVNSSYDEGDPSISSDGLELYFLSNRPGGYGGQIGDIWVTTRETVSDPWGTPVNLGPPVNTSFDDFCQVISADGLSLYFTSNRPGGYGLCSLWVTTRATTEDDWGTPVNLGPTVNSVNAEQAPCISADGLWLFFESARPGGIGNPDIWVTSRATTEDDWGTPVNLGPTVNSSNGEKMPYISSDGLTLYFGSNRPSGLGNGDLWQVSIEPVVDLNGDGIVDSADLCIIVDHWGEYYPWCDIGPTPLGDGIVDVQDLIVLAEHLFEDVNDPKLLAHWALDETEGIIAHDSSGYNDADIVGDPTWQPTDGIVNGALQLDGIDDCVLTGAVPNPAEGPFSIFVWIKGGSAGQVVISQLGGGVNWLLADPVEGNLMTELTSPGRSGSPMLSRTNITDGEWHRVGFVWDGSIRTLYVDGVAVAEDTQDGLEGTYSGLYIGTGKAMESGTYWSGLIDDIRIYNRAVTP